MSGPRLALALLAGAWSAHAADTVRYFDPWHVTDAALAPDGRHVAYLTWAGERRTEVVIADCDRPGLTASAVIAERGKKVGSQPSALQWAGPDQVQVRTRFGEWWAVTPAGKLLRLDHTPPAPAARGPAAPADWTTRFPDRTVTVTDRDEADTRLILLVTSREEPGRYFLFDRPLRQVSEFVRRLPLVPAMELAEIRECSVQLSPGEAVGAWVALSKLKPASAKAAVLFCRDRSQPAEAGAYEPELHALAAAGFAAIEFSRAPAAPERADRALRLVLEQLGLDPARVALVATGDGASLAHRLLAVRPEPFRCAVILDGPLALIPHDPSPTLRLATEPGHRGAAWVQAIAFLRQKL